MSHKRLTIRSRPITSPNDDHSFVQIEARHHSYAVSLLRSRLIRPSTIDVTILSPDVNLLQMKAHQYPGRYIGYFHHEPRTRPCFILFCRLDPESTVDYVYIFYVRSRLRIAQRPQLLLLQKQLPVPTAGCPEPYKIGIINFQTDNTSPVLDLSFLIEAVDMSIGPRLISFYKSVPPVHDIYPHHDPKQLYLHKLPSFVDGLNFLGDLWNAFASTTVFPAIQDDDLGNSGFQPSSASRFWLLPILGEHDAIVVVDNHLRDWIYLNPNLKASRDSSLFDDIAAVIFQHASD